MFIQEELDRYFYWINERESIRYVKEQTDETPPYSKDPIFNNYKFCQVFREDDRTTRWFRRHIREPLKDDPDVFMATVIFRWFNLIDTGRTLIENDLLFNWDRQKAIDLIKEQDQWITGAYIIKTPNGMDKVSGVAECISHMWNDREYLIEQSKGCNLETFWKIIRAYPYMGPFMAYEVVTDLRHTCILNQANDIYTWANAGPGAMRGLNRLTGRDLKYARRTHDWCDEMVELYSLCEGNLSPLIARSSNEFELREIEGGLCEFDKYSRIYKGEGRTRSIFKPSDLPIVEDCGSNGESNYDIRR